MKGFLAFKSGHNLGSHRFGGFFENFSRSECFCRYCLLARKDFVPEFPWFPQRTEVSYNEAVAVLKSNENLESS